MHPSAKTKRLTIKSSSHWKDGVKHISFAKLKLSDAMVFVLWCVGAIEIVDLLRSDSSDITASCSLPRPSFRRLNLHRWSPSRSNGWHLIAPSPIGSPKCVTPCAPRLRFPRFNHDCPIDLDLRPAFNHVFVHFSPSGLLIISSEDSCHWPFYDLTVHS